MAVVLLFRVALQLAPAAYRICAGPTLDPQTCSHRLESVWNLLTDPAADPDAISATLTAQGGGADGEGIWFVTDFTDTFELRKLQWRLSRAPSGGTIEDVDVMTFHFIKATGGVAGTYNDATDLAAVETSTNTLTTTLKAFWPTFMHSDQYRWYKDGPAFYKAPDAGQPYYIPVGDNPAIRITEVDTAGTGSGNANAPQLAMSVTEVTSQRKHWGRFYVPTPVSTVLSTDGRIPSGNVTTILQAVVDHYNRCRTASMVPVVFSIQKPDRPKKPSGTLAASPATAYEVLSLQMDDLFDVIRSRRYSQPTVKPRTALT